MLSLSTFGLPILEIVIFFFSIAAVVWGILTPHSNLRPQGAAGCTWLPETYSVRYPVRENLVVNMQFF